jgi:PPM family protein phosphatase
MRIIPGNAQHIGSRKEQQDDFGFSDIGNVTFINHGGILAVIADGMGGLARGREASLIAKQAMLQEYDRKSVHKTVPQALIRALSVANAAVVEMASKAGLEGQTGSTLVAAVIKDDELHWVSVGDSRIYLYRRGQLIQLTTDHDYGRQLAQEVAAGNLSPAVAAAHPQRQALTSYLGLPFLSEINRNEDPVILEEGDRILLCSDGLYKTVPEDEIVKFLDRESQPAADGLVEATLARGRTNQDNVTVAILACEPDVEISGFRYVMSSLAFYGKLILIILILLLFLGGGAYLAARYYYPSLLAGPAEPPASEAAPTGSRAATPAPDLAQRVANLEIQMEQIQKSLAELGSRTGAPAAAREQGVPVPASPAPGAVKTGNTPDPETIGDHQKSRTKKGPKRKKRGQVEPKTP